MGSFACFQFATFITQFHFHIKQILGKFPCTFFPFVQTSTVLADSMALVSIALDRYLAVSNKTKGQWRPGKLFCFCGFLIVWIISAAISSPMLFSYDLVQVVVVTDIDANAFFISQWCITPKVSCD